MKACPCFPGARPGGPPALRCSAALHVSVVRSARVPVPPSSLTPPLPSLECSPPPPSSFLSSACPIPRLSSPHSFATQTCTPSRPPRSRRLTRRRWRAAPTRSRWEGVARAARCLPLQALAEPRWPPASRRPRGCADGQLCTARGGPAAALARRPACSRATCWQAADSAPVPACLPARLASHRIDRPLPVS